MIHCEKENLAHLIADDLDVDTKIDILEHLEVCTTCKDAYYGMTRERDSVLFVHRRYNVDRVARGHT